MSTTTRYVVVVLLAGLMSSCDSSTTPAGPTPSPSPTQTQTPTANPAPAPASDPIPAPTPNPSPTPPPPTPPPIPPAPTLTTFEMTGVVRDRSTARGIASAQVQIVEGVNLGRSATTDGSGAYRLERLNSGAMRIRVTANEFSSQTFDIPLTGNLTLNFELVAIPMYTYSGIVTDGQGRPVAGATVRGGPNSGSTDANGRYEFRSQYSSVPGNVYPPAGYERKPVRLTDSFVLTPGQNITIRRITNLTINPGTTMLVGERRYVSAHVTFDAGVVESPILEIFELNSSDLSIIRAGSGSAEMDRISVWGVAPGTASVTGRYFGVSSEPKQVLVVP